MSDPFFTPVRKAGAGGGRGGGKSGPRSGPKSGPKSDHGKKRKTRSNVSDDEATTTSRGNRRKSAKTEDDDEGGDAIGAGGIDDMDLEFHGSENDSEDDALSNETAAQKRLRLAKNYIDALQHAEGIGDEQMEREEKGER
jgi:ribosomal RNA-processing protein 9